MGFWDSVKELGGALVEGVKEYLDEQKERASDYRERYEHMDDKTLLRIYKSGDTHGVKRVVIAQILSERGYGSSSDRFSTYSLNHISRGGCHNEAANSMPVRKTVGYCY